MKMLTKMTKAKNQRK